MKTSAKDLCFEMLQAARGGVLQSIALEQPGEGMTLVVDLRHPLGQSLANGTGMPNEEIIAAVSSAKKSGAIPWSVDWIPAPDALELTVNQEKK